jgi:signal transduction histidine kinase
MCSVFWWGAATSPRLVGTGFDSDDRVFEISPKEGTADLKRLNNGDGEARFEAWVMSDHGTGHIDSSWERDSKRTTSLMRTASYTLLVCAAYYAGAKLGFALRLHPHPVSPLWPPNAILLAALILAPVRLWWVLLLAVFPVHMAIQLKTGVPIQMALLWFASNAIEALIGALGLRRFSDNPLRLDSFRRAVIFLKFVVFLAPFLSTFLDAAFVTLIGWGESSYWQVWRMRLFSNVLAALTIVPVLVQAGASGIGPIWRAILRRRVEVTLFSAGLVAVGLIAFETEGVGLIHVVALIYAPLPFLLWAAVRFGPGGLSASLLFTSLLAIWGAIKGLGPFTTLSPTENVFSLQIFLILMSMPLMLLAAVLQERRLTEQSLRQNEEALRESHAQIQDLAGRLIIAQEEERKLLKRELHEDLNQQVASLAIELGYLGFQLPDAEDSIRNQICKLEGRTSLLSEQMSRMSHKLHSSTLEYIGLAEALKYHCSEFSDREGIPVRLNLQTDFDDIPYDAALCLYRVVQESLNNIARHSGARFATVTLASDSETIELSVADQGVGFDPAPQSLRRGLGLITIRERVRLLRGSFDLKSQPSVGTVVKVRLSLRSEK